MASKPTATTKAKTRGGAKRVVLRVLGVLLGIALITGIAGIAAVAVMYNRTDLPDPNADFQTNTSFVYFRDGKTKLGSFSVQNRQTLTYDKMPQNIKDATIAAENRTFWTDRGISPSGIARSAWVIARGGEVQGGSTITQQYIKILYLTDERSVERKLKELMLAVKLGREKSKEQILEGYLNTIYFGRGAYGIQAASRSYFNTSAKNLSVPEAAVLASVLNNPSIYDPSAAKGNKERLLERYRYVLQGMAEMGTITEAERAKYAKKLPKFPNIPTNSRFGGPKGFLLKMVQDELLAQGFTEAQINGGGLRIVTTFDPDAQDAAVKSAKDITKQAASARGKSTKNLHAAIASVEVGTGEVLAIYGGPDYVANSRNWATTDRPTASTFKTYAAAAALDSGEYSLRSVLNGNTFTPPGDGVPIRNEFSYQYGPVTLTKATSDSINTAFVDLVQGMTDGPKRVIDAARAAGIEKGAGWDANNRIALGTAEASPLEQAGAYATFANNGTRVANHVVKSVKAGGKTLYKAEPAKKRAFSDGVARDVTYALSTVVEQGTGTSVQTLGRPVAGKTGTAGVEDDIVSAWFVAYTKQISTAVMFVAGDAGTSDLDDYARPGDQTFFGGTYPAMAWREYMQVATQGQEIQQFDPPANINRDTGKSQQPIYTPRRTTTTTTTSNRRTTTAPAETSGKAPTSKSTPTGNGGNDGGGEETTDPGEGDGGGGDGGGDAGNAVEQPGG